MMMTTTPMPMPIPMMMVVVVMMMVAMQTSNKSTCVQPSYPGWHTDCLSTLACSAILPSISK